MEGIGKVNRYVCENCGASHGTINLNTGTTPFLIGCKSCSGMAQSSMYHLPAGEIGCGWVWYRPIVEEFRRLTADEQEHILMSGLLLGEFGSVTAMIETDEVYEMISSEDSDRWLMFVVAAYKPDTSLFQEIVSRFKTQL